MPMDDCPTRDDHSYLFDLDDSHGRIEVDSTFNSPSIAPLSKGCLEYYGIYCCSLDMCLYISG